MGPVGTPDGEGADQLEVMGWPQALPVPLNHVYPTAALSVFISIGGGHDEVVAAAITETVVRPAPSVPSSPRRWLSLTTCVISDTA